MLELTRLLARQFRAAMRRCVPAGCQRRAPAVLIRAGPEGLSLEARLDRVGLLYHEDGPRPKAALALKIDDLSRFEGKVKAPVVLEGGPGKVRARWPEGTADRDAEFDAVPIDAVRPLPDVPGELVPLSAVCREALAEAARTAAREATRLVCTCLFLRGATGEVVATDGRQLLIQGGFPLPWREDVLVPSVAFLTGRELGEGPLRLGRAKDHVVLVSGPWALFLEEDRASRFPDYTQVVPRPAPTCPHVEVHPEDAAFLVKALPELPGAGEDHAPVTLDLGKGAAAVRSGEGDKVTEVVLSRSQSAGPSTRVAFSRTYLLRALQLGFLRVEVPGPGKPVVCRDDRRTYLWMPLDGNGAVLPSRRAVVVPSDGRHPSRLLPGPAAPEVPPPAGPSPAVPSPSAPSPEAPLPVPARRRPAVSAPPQPPANGKPPGPAEAGSLEELISEAECLRGLLHEAGARLGRLVAALKHQRRQARAVQAAVASLRQLQHLGP